MITIELTKRTEGEKEAYMQGYAAGKRDKCEKIKKEIEHKKFRTMEIQISDAHLGFNGGLECALAIIDKYLQEVEE